MGNNDFWKECTFCYEGDKGNFPHWEIGVIQLNLTRRKRALSGPADQSVENQPLLFYGETGLFTVFCIRRLDCGDYFVIPCCGVRG